MSKINWLQVQNEYVTDESISHEDIAKKYRVSRSQVTRVASKNNWLELRQKSKQSATDKLPEKVGEELSKVNARHIQTARILQTIGMRTFLGDTNNNIAQLHPTSFDHARKAVETGVTIERKATGLDKSEQAPKVNILNLIAGEREKYGF